MSKKQITPSEYIRGAIRTNTGLKIPIGEHNEDLLHACLGIGTEAGELQDQLKRFLFYSAPLDMTNIKEELGDLLWYIALLCYWSDLSIEEIMETNLEKLRVRYPEKFHIQNALLRNTQKETEALES